MRLKKIKRKNREKAVSKEEEMNKATDALKLLSQKCQVSRK